jgi:branched-chain amino acid transport system ATP-binding protein
MALVMRVAQRYCAMAKGSVVAQGRVGEESLDELHRHVMV